MRAIITSACRAIMKKKKRKILISTPQTAALISLSANAIHAKTGSATRRRRRRNIAAKNECSQQLNHRWKSASASTGFMRLINIYGRSEEAARFIGFEKCSAEELLCGVCFILEKRWLSCIVIIDFIYCKISLRCINSHEFIVYNFLITVSG